MSAEIVEQPKKKRGQPRKITPHLARKIFLLYAQGLTDQQIADVFDLNRDTISEFKKLPEYSDTIRRAKTQADLTIVNALFMRAKGYSHPEMKVFCHEGEIIEHEVIKHYPPEVRACEIWLTNRLKDEWRKEIQKEDPAAKPKPAMIRLFSKVSNEETTIISRGENQIDVLFGPDFTDKAKTDAAHPPDGHNRITP